MTITFEQAKACIDGLDLTDVINRVKKENRWTQRMAETAAHFYKNYLLLCKKYPEYKLSPTNQIDEIWHAHILYTKDYREFCDKVFGYYLDHQPTHEEETSNEEFGKKDNIDLLQRLHLKEFQYPIYDTVFSFKDIWIFLSRNFVK